MNTTYRETFDDGPGGWYGFISNHEGMKPLEWQPGSVTSRSPWWIDYNHAPPGAGYMHMVLTLNTRGPETESIKDAAGPNRFVAGGFPTNFCDARLTVRTRGELLTRGADLVLLVQGNVEGIISGGPRSPTNQLGIPLTLNCNKAYPSPPRPEKGALLYPSGAE